MVNERQTDTCADVMYRRERQRGCGEAGITPEILRKLVEGLR